MMRRCSCPLRPNDCSTMEAKLPTYLATMRVIHVETWEVEADDEKAARSAFGELSEKVAVDETGGETVDWEIISIRREPD